MKTIEEVFNATGLAKLGYSCHLRSADDTMRVYSSMSQAASLRIYVKGDEMRCTVYTVLPQSLMKVEIGDISFPHPDIMQFINQVEELYNLWIFSDWCQR